MEIYRHQVGGHSRLLKPQDSSKVFKPYSESEHRFYERLVGLGATSTDSGPLHVLKQFVPKYFGLTEVQVQTTMLPASSSGGRSFSLQSTSKVSSDAQKLLLGSSPLVCQRGNGENSFLPEKVVKNTSLCDQACPRFNAEGFSSMSLDAENPPTRLGAAGGSLAVDADIAGRKNGYLKALPAEERPAASAKSVMTASSSSTHTLKYIVLEDLVYMYKKPCVMDIKMGKRQRKIGASPEKEQRQIEKSLKTTSHALGFRLCGCQYYDKKENTLCYRDKYWGRKLTKDKLFSSIAQWFWNGYIVYHELIIPLVNSLKILHACIAELRQYRFWSSSILWVYDGGLSDSKARIQSLNVKMIDFANTIVLKDQPTQDEEYLFGLGNIIAILELLARTAVPHPAAVKFPVKLPHLDWTQTRHGVSSELGSNDFPVAAETTKAGASEAHQFRRENVLDTSAICQSEEDVSVPPSPGWPPLSRRAAALSTARGPKTAHLLTFQRLCNPTLRQHRCRVSGQSRRAIVSRCAYRRLVSRRHPAMIVGNFSVAKENKADPSHERPVEERQKDVLRGPARRPEQTRRPLFKITNSKETMVLASRKYAAERKEDEECGADAENSETDEDVVDEIKTSSSLTGCKCGSEKSCDARANWELVERQECSRLRRPNSVFWPENSDFRQNFNSSSSSESTGHSESFIDGVSSREHTASETAPQLCSSAANQVLKTGQRRSGLAVNDNASMVVSSQYAKSRVEKEGSSCCVVSYVASRSNGFGHLCWNSGRHSKDPIRTDQKTRRSPSAVPTHDLQSLVAEGADGDVENVCDSSNTCTVTRRSSGMRCETKSSSTLSPLWASYCGKNSSVLTKKTYFSRRRSRKPLRHFLSPVLASSFCAECLKKTKTDTLLPAYARGKPRFCASAPCLVSLDLLTTDAQYDAAIPETSVEKLSDSNVTPVTQFPLRVPSFDKSLNGRPVSAPLTTESCGTQCHTLPLDAAKFDPADCDRSLHPQAKASVTPHPLNVMDIQIFGPPLEQSSDSFSSDDMVNQGDVDSDNEQNVASRHVAEKQHVNLFLRSFTGGVYRGARASSVCVPRHSNSSPSSSDKFDDTLLS